jgi:prepilin-type N-terminal cleavage/methylation domain-containing protein
MTSRSARLRSQRGYTLIEVMVAIAISAIGISGIVAMQSATARSNQDAHETQVATMFARTWIERIKRDAVMWTAAGNPAPGVIFAGRNLGLANSGNYFVPDAPNNDAWGVPIPMAGAPESPGANFHGVDVGAQDRLLPGAPVVQNADIYYCVNTKFAQIHVVGGLTNAMRADVRVWWSRKASLDQTNYVGGITLVRGAGCQSSIPTSVTLRNGAFRVVYLSTFLRWTAPT